MSEKLEVILYCFCGEDHKQEIDLPAGWDSRYHSASDDQAFCPKHAIIAKFAESQCPGCIGGWKDCELHNSFAFNRVTIDEDDFAIMRTGKCPKRCGGTFGYSENGLEEIDLTDPPNAEAGAALEVAIKEYIVKYKSLTS